MYDAHLMHNNQNTINVYSQPTAQQMRSLALVKGALYRGQSIELLIHLQGIFNIIPLLN